MKISIRAPKSITLLPGSPILKVEGPPLFASTTTPTTLSIIDIDKNNSSGTRLFDY